MDCRTDGRLDADAIPSNGRVARCLHFAVRVDERAVHGPVGPPICAGLDRAPASYGGRAALGTPTLGLEGGDRVGELYLGATEAIEVLFGPARCELRFGELGLPLMLEIAEVVLLHPLVVPVLLECLLQMHQPIAITRQLIAQLFDARNEGAIVQREGMKILVTCNEL